MASLTRTIVESRGPCRILNVEKIPKTTGCLIGIPMLKTKSSTSAWAHDNQPPGLDHHVVCIASHHG